LDLFVKNTDGGFIQLAKFLDELSKGKDVFYGGKYRLQKDKNGNMFVNIYAIRKGIPILVKFKKHSVDPRLRLKPDSEAFFVLSRQLGEYITSKYGSVYRATAKSATDRDQELDIRQLGTQKLLVGTMGAKLVQYGVVIPPNPPLYALTVTIHDSDIQRRKVRRDCTRKVWKTAERLSSGHFGAVHVACVITEQEPDSIKDCNYVVKIQTYNHVFRNEVAIMEKLNQYYNTTGIKLAPYMYDAFVCRPNGYIIMEKMDTDLKHFWKQSEDKDKVKPLTAEMKTRIKWLFEHLESLNIDYADWHPGNILVKDGLLYISDFGLSIDFSGISNIQMIRNAEYDQTNAIDSFKESHKALLNFFDNPND